MWHDGIDGGKHLLNSKDAGELGVEELIGERVDGLVDGLVDEVSVDEARVVVELPVQVSVV